VYQEGLNQQPNRTAVPLRTREEKADSLYHTALQEMRRGTISAHAQSFFQVRWETGIVR
jgi:hypothetical protein